MKTSDKKRRTQRQIIQQKWERLAASFNESVPPSGWLKAVRGSLGLSIRQLANRLNVSHGSISQLEKREPEKRVTLEALERAAQAMDCKLIYAIVPKDSGLSLDDIIKRRALAAAAQILQEVSHTMRLEDQGTSEKEIQTEINRIASELIESNDPKIWNFDENRKTKSHV